MNIDKIPNWLRWLLVFPTSAITGLLCGIAVNLFYKFLTIVWALTEDSVPARYSTSPDNAFDYYAYQTIAGFCIGFGFVYAGRKMSPSFEKRAGYVLAVVLILLSAMSLIGSISGGHWSTSLNGVSAIAGAIIAAKRNSIDDIFY